MIKYFNNLTTVMFLWTLVLSLLLGMALGSLWNIAHDLALSGVFR